MELRWVRHGNGELTRKLKNTDTTLHRLSTSEISLILLLIRGSSAYSYIIVLIFMKTMVKDTENVFKCGISVAPVTSWLYYGNIYFLRPSAHLLLLHFRFYPAQC